MNHLNHLVSNRKSIPTKPKHIEEEAAVEKLAYVKNLKLLRNLIKEMDINSHKDLKESDDLKLKEKQILEEMKMKNIDIIDDVDEGKQLIEEQIEKKLEIDESKPFNISNKNEILASDWTIWFFIQIMIILIGICIIYFARVK